MGGFEDYMVATLAQAIPGAVLGYISPAFFRKSRSRVILIGIASAASLSVLSVTLWSNCIVSCIYGATTRRITLGKNMVI